MSIISHIGLISRALPIDGNMSLKLNTEHGAVICEIPSNRPELIERARQARMNEAEVLIRVMDDMVLAIEDPAVDKAA
jgi:hypothetical protein